MFANYSEAWGLPWNVMDMPREVLLEKADTSVSILQRNETGNIVSSRRIQPIEGQREKFSRSTGKDLPTKIDVCSNVIF